MAEIFHRSLREGHGPTKGEEGETIIVGWFLVNRKRTQFHSRHRDGSLLPRALQRQCNLKLNSTTCSESWRVGKIISLRTTFLLPLRTSSSGAAEGLVERVNK